MELARQRLRLTLSSSSLPVGSFLVAGLEWAVETGWVTDAEGVQKLANPADGAEPFLRRPAAVCPALPGL